MIRRPIVIKDVCKLNAETIGSKNAPQIIRYLDTSNITRNKIESIQTLDSRIAPFPSRAQRKVKSKTIIYSTVRPEQEHFGFIEQSETCLIVSTGFVTIDVFDETIDPKFLFYSLTRKEITRYLQTIAVNNVSSYPSINPDDLGELELEIPSEITVQLKIAAVLSALDAKIEISNQINEELEAMAKTIYDYWFVQFDFPDENGKPYKTSGGKMVWNEALNRKIPAGWVDKSLAEITSVSNESVNPTGFPKREFKHYSIPAFDEVGTYKIENGEEIRSNKFLIRNTDVLVSKLNPWFNRVIYATEESNLVSSTEFVVWRTDSIAIKNYLYMIARDGSFVKYCTQSATGTSNSHKRVNPTVMMKYRIAINPKIAERFGHVLDSTIKMYAKNQIETKTLADLRDWLLPMLMNGQVKVA